MFIFRELFIFGNYVKRPNIPPITDTGEEGLILEFCGRCIFNSFIPPALPSLRIEKTSLNLKSSNTFSLTTPLNPN